MSETLTSTASSRNDTMASRRSSTTMSTSIISMQLDVDTMQTPSEYLTAMKNTKNEAKLLQVCEKLSLCFQGDRQLTESLDVEEVVRVTYQVMINHPLNPNLLQFACEIIWQCNERVEYRHTIEEYCVFRPILVAIKNHKKNPYFLGTAMNALASIANSALSCKGLRQCQAYLDITSVLRENQYDIFVLKGGLVALAHVLRNDSFAQNNLIQIGYHKLLKNIVKSHSQNSSIICNACLVLRQLATLETSKCVLLESKSFQMCLGLLESYAEDEKVTTSVCGLLEALSSSFDFIEVVTAAKVSLGAKIFSCLNRHSNSTDLCSYCFLIFHHILHSSPLLVDDIKLEDLLRFMCTVNEVHGSNVDFQEAFCRCLSSLFEASPQLHMFVGDGESDASQIRVPLLNWIWVVLLSNIQDTQNYKVYEAVCLTIYYLVVDSNRLRKYFLDKGAAPAIFEGLRRFIGFPEVKFENSLQYSCQVLVALLMSDAKEAKQFLININVVYDLIDILDHHIASPNITAEALGVIACLSDDDDFRKAASQQNIHTRILNAIQYKPTHAVLVECSIEVLIIFAQTDEKLHVVYNEAGILREIIDIMSRDMGESITCKCLMLLHVIADEDHLSTYPNDGHRIGWLLNRFLMPSQQYNLLIIEALVCACSLCKSCPSVIPQLLVDCEIDINLFKLLYSRHRTDIPCDEDNPDYLIYELAIDIIHSLSLREGCCHKMLLSAIKHHMIEAIKLLVDIGADINDYDESNQNNSPIYQAVLSSNDEVVECILDYKVTNENSLKDALRLAREMQLDYITGLLLKALALNIERRTLNIGGLNLEEIRPIWLYPSLGIKQRASTKGHKRRHSLDYVASGIKRRQSVGESPMKELIAKGLLNPPSINPTVEPVQSNGGGNAQKKSSEAEDAYQLSKSWDSNLFEATPYGARFGEKPQKKASRPPTLPTVISSPLSNVKLRPDSPNGSETLSLESESQFLGSLPSGTDMVDNEPTSSIFYIQRSVDFDEGKSQDCAHQRRHAEISRTMTGARHVAFNTLDMYQRNRGNTLTSLLSPNDSLVSNYNDPVSTSYIKRAAQRSRRKKGDLRNYVGSYSESPSPFYSSEEGTLVDSGSLANSANSYKDLLNSVTATPQSKRSELLSNLAYSYENSAKQGGGVDETDSPHVAPPTPTPPMVSLLVNTFDVSANKLKTLDTLFSEGNDIALKLRELILMDAKQNSLSSLPSLLYQELTKLQRLLLGQNCFTIFPLEINFCRRLVELDLSGNKIASFPEENVVLPHLDKLNLSSNCLTVFPVSLNGDSFPSLKKLHLESNQISEIEDRDLKMKNLQELYISKNALKKLPFAFLAGLTSLRALDASRNSLELLPGEAAEYTCSLQELKVGYNKLGVKEHEFHSFIKTALVIQIVDGTDNDLLSIPPPYMWRSRGLKHLLLKTNKITSLDLTDCDKFWPQLERLVVADNKLKEIPPDIGKLRTLTSLDISHNRDLRSLPNEMGKLEFLFYLNLQGLKNLNIDRTLSAKAVVRYLKAKLIQSRPCYTMKMTIVGSAGKGKTTLLHLLLNEKSSKIENTATLGVQIRKWIYQQRPGVNYIINCWDFAGQEEFYSTHQCFLTPRTIYILVYNISKAESELDGLIPWLLNIQARAPGSPVIIVGTHRDMIAPDHFSSVKKNMRQHINEIIIKPGFPQDVTFAEISCVGQKVGLDNLRAKIKEKIDGAKLRGQKIMGEMVPASYLDLASMLEEESKRLSKTKSTFHVLRRHQLFELMSKTDLAQKMDRIEIEQAVQFLHECGTLLHYDDIQSNLSDLFFVDPQWLCSLMAKIITIKQLTLISSKGTLHVKDLPLLLRGSQFPSEFITEYIRLLEWFNVALQISSDNILIPSYLPKHKPAPIPLPSDSRNLIIRKYNMCFIPPGFWPRLVIRLLTFPRKAVQLTEPTKQIYWYSGIYSFWSLQAYFIIEELEGSKNDFSITVPNTPEGIRLLCSVVDNVETLIDEWFPGLRNVDIASGDALVRPSALCPMCPAFNINSFPMKELQQLSITKDEVFCPVHNDMVSLKLLSPDIIISDLSPSYHVSRDDVIMDENNPATVLGKGGFGEVYKAMYKNRPVAVKVFSPLVAEMHNTTPNQLIRQEVSILSQMIHPNIVRLEGVCLRPKPMLLLEFAELCSLASFSPYSTISPNLKHKISLQVVNALAFLHKNNVIYRDLKPGNILIFSLSLNAVVNAKLSDYGISTYATTSGLTQDIGTNGYKAPEILKAKTTKMPYDTKVDIYSFGIVLFQLITNGHAPFEDLAPHERDRATEEGRPIKNPSYYGGPPWPDMYDVILQCLQYIPKHRPSALEIFDRMCCPDFMALRQVIPIYQNWEVLTFTVKNYIQKNDVMTDVWLSSCDVGQQSILSVVNISNKSSQPQGKMMPQNTLVYSMIAIGQLVLLGTNNGDILVYESYDKKEHRLAPLADSVLCFCSVRRRDEGKSYVFAGLANGFLIAFDHKVLKTPKSLPEHILPLNKGPVKGMKRLHNRLLIISGLEVAVINLSDITICSRWIACDDMSRKFLTCIEVDENVVWTSSNNSSIIQGWDTDDGSHRMSINTYSCLQKFDQPLPVLSDVPDRYSCRVTALYLQSSSPSLLWAGIASGHLFIFDTVTGHPLMITRRHTSAIRSIQSLKTTSHERPTNVVLTSGLGFVANSFSRNDSPDTNSLDHYGVLLIWDSSMPQVKPAFDEMRKQQQPFR